MTSVPQLLNFVAVAAGAATEGKNSAQTAGPEGLTGQAGGEQAGQGEERIDFGALLRDLVLEGMMPEEFKHPFTLQVPADVQQDSTEKATDGPAESADAQTVSVGALVPVGGNTSAMADQGVPLTGALVELLQGAVHQFTQLSAQAGDSSQSDDAQSVVHAIAALTQTAGLKGAVHAAATEAVTSGETALPAQLVAMLRNARSSATPQANPTSVGGETPSSTMAPVVSEGPAAPPVSVSRETHAATPGIVVAKSKTLVSGQGDVASRQQPQAASQPELAQRTTAEPAVTSDVSRPAQEVTKNLTTTGALVAEPAETQTTRSNPSSSTPAASTPPASALVGSQPAVQPNGQVPLDSSPPAPPTTSAAGASPSVTTSPTAGQAQAVVGVNAPSPIAPHTPVAAAHATSPATPTTPPAAVELARQVSAKFGALREMGAGTHQLSIKVTPEEFGPIRVVARIEAGSVGIDLHTASAAGRELLKAAMADIRRDLPPNLAGATVNVADNGTSQGSNTNAGQQSTSQGGAAFDGRGGSRGGDNGTAAGSEQQHTAVTEPEINTKAASYEGGVDVLT